MSYDQVSLDEIDNKMNGSVEVTDQEHAKLWRISLCQAIDTGNPEIVALVLDSGLNIQVECGTENTPLYMAACKGFADIVGMLIQHDENIDGIDLNLSALHIAAHEGDLASVRILIKQGIKTHAKCNKGRTALDISKEKGHDDITSILEVRVA